MTTREPIPELCHHDDPSWCGPECAAKVDAFDAWVRQKLSKEKQEAYGVIVKIAAELAHCGHMPSEHPDDHKWYRSTPVAERRRIIKENEKACDYSRELAMKLRRAADDLVRRIT